VIGQKKQLLACCCFFDQSPTTNQIRKDSLLSEKLFWIVSIINFCF